MSWAVVAAACLLLGAGPTRACGGDDPCRIEGGQYHARAPEGPARGAVLFLHGYGGTGAAAIRDDRIVAPLLARGYVVVAPTGTPMRPDASGASWNAFGPPGALSERDDRAFLRRVAADAAGRFGFPRASVVISGFSGGGMMVWRSACDAPGDFAAYAPVAGLLWRPLPAACAGPVRMLHTHGWTDATVPLEGRSIGGGRIVQGDLFAGLALLRRALGCARDDPDRFEARGDTLVRRWTACSPGAELALALHPGGHTVPDGWGPGMLDWFEALPPKR